VLRPAWAKGPGAAYRVVADGSLVAAVNGDMQRGSQPVITLSPALFGLPRGAPEGYAGESWRKRPFAFPIHPPLYELSTDDA